jgi:D-lactate dehydrogenase
VRRPAPGARRPAPCLPRLQVVQQLADSGVKLVAMRCAGYDRVDLAACQAAGIQVVRVPTYSPTSVAEHAVALMFALHR